MRFGSICSGIEAASAAMKRCARCELTKAITEFHRSRNTKSGRHSWCAACSTKAQRESRTRNHTPEQKRRWLLKTRYGVTTQQVQAMHDAQGGRCGICDRTLGAKFHIDHSHATGCVRGLLCHRCNIAIGGWDDPQFKARALAWLERGA